MILSLFLVQALGWAFGTYQSPRCHKKTTEKP